MDPTLLGGLVSDASFPAFVPERRDAQTIYVGLACRCGSASFHLSGWSRVATGSGDFFWRTVSRVWREARLGGRDGVPVEPPFWLPALARCGRCSREAVLLEGVPVARTMDVARRDEACESFRCRVCGWGSIEWVLGSAEDSEFASRTDFEVLVHCRHCEGQARVAWPEGGHPSEQEMRLDLLCGRR
ncbi:MAG: hypothetical protein GY910_06095 [bacterium]|nr:hypothetical protein [bacterium]